MANFGAHTTLLATNFPTAIASPITHALLLGSRFLPDSNWLNVPSCKHYGLSERRQGRSQPPGAISLYVWQFKYIKAVPSFGSGGVKQVDQSLMQHATAKNIKSNRVHGRQVLMVEHKSQIGRLHHFPLMQADQDISPLQAGPVCR